MKQVNYRNPRNRVRPGHSVRRQCLICMGGSSPDVAACLSIHCLLYPYRLGTGRVTLKLIRNYCLHCCGWPLKDSKLDPDYKGGGQAEARNEARNCTGYDCPFWLYRPGTKPYAGRGHDNIAEWNTAKGRFDDSESPKPEQRL